MLRQAATEQSGGAPGRSCVRAIDIWPPIRVSLACALAGFFPFAPVRGRSVSLDGASPLTYLNIRIKRVTRNLCGTIHVRQVQRAHRAPAERGECATPVGRGTD